MGSVTITVCEHLPTGEWLLAFAADGASAFEEMVRSIKQGIHATQRQWMPEQKCWKISNFGMQQFWQFMPDLREPMQRMAREAPRQQSGQQSGQRRQSARGNVAPVEIAEAFTALFLIPSAPLPVIKAAYRALANIYHPDHGGAHDTMLRLNRAYEQACAWANKTTGKAG